MGCGCVTNYPYRKGVPRVIGSTDVYSKKHIDRALDRLDRLHDLHSEKIRDLRRALARLQGLINADEEEEERG